MRPLPPMLAPGSQARLQPERHYLPAISRVVSHHTMSTIKLPYLKIVQYLTAYQS